ncbi:mating pair formation protein [Burkholderia cenocepacia]|uniref:mating pair formation protein n=1 Tax=Burkholderia cenocepacia TaxID=95486 RepID=UPI000F5BEFF5|nr:mating pair formation protein [Burkholderia cenocepacia]
MNPLVITLQYRLLAIYQKRQRMLNELISMIVACTLVGAMPMTAYAAADYSTATGIFKAFLQWMFFDGGPYIWMAISAVLVLGVPKGWVQMKTAVITICTCFVFFCIPSIVRYMSNQAAASL